MYSNTFQEYRYCCLVFLIILFAQEPLGTDRWLLKRCVILTEEEEVRSYDYEAREDR